MTDEIIQEVWRVKDEIAKQRNYDLDVLAEMLRRQQKESDRKVVNLEKEAAKQNVEPHHNH